MREESQTLLLRVIPAAVEGLGLVGGKVAGGVEPAPEVTGADTNVGLAVDLKLVETQRSLHPAGNASEECGMLSTTRSIIMNIKHLNEYISTSPKAVFPRP